MGVVNENVGTVALLEATAEARTLIEDLTQLAEELKIRQERLGELLAPSEAALRARTDYLDKVMREQLGLAQQRVVKLGEEVHRIAGQLNDQLIQMPALLAEADAQRWNERVRRDWWGTVPGLLALLLGGLLAGEMASCRSGQSINTRPASATQRPSVSKSGSPTPRRPAPSSVRPRASPGH